ncbi:ArsR/SmtB family transcription factor [Oceanibaculum pacificum]|uniref:ArsR family transcriptional regulator n=1 Tax=Oceanibaculum pacificum TaxID=580166 RepID=A0A154WEX0_9PROT|nr:metalloregulator ArsR/SmtB family transcription factor [Oceanibaculum pacificum]KZD12067.1 ArsR family transcriptional regulator [Oceanibaculum pacificum]
METIIAIQRLTALAQETRLAIYRLLVPAGEDGLAAGLIAETLGVSPATLSFHLKELDRAGLITARRDGRSIFYAADYDGMRDLLSFLAEDCCQGRPELCAPISCLPATKGSRA